MFSIWCYLSKCVHIVHLAAYYTEKVARETSDIVAEHVKGRILRLIITPHAITAGQGCDLPCEGRMWYKKYIENTWYQHSDCYQKDNKDIKITTKAYDPVWQGI